MKRELADWAINGGTPLFENAPIGTSCLAKPDIALFNHYSEIFISSGQFTNNGPLCRLLEKRLADYHNAQYCVAVANGFWGLILAMDALKISDRNEIIMPSLTYRRLADAALWVGLVPVFCDVDERTLAISPESVLKKIGAKTALILAVHPIVNCCDTAGISKIAHEHNIPVLFDSVESSYEENEQGRIGSLGIAEVFSMHASKLINAGEGGYITTSSQDLYERIKLARSFGFSSPDNVTVPDGFNAKLNEMHAAMALANLDQLDKLVEHNKQIYMHYKESLSAIGSLRLVEFDERYKTSYKNIVVRLIDNWPISRDFTLRILNKENILARAYYSPPLHRRHADLVGATTDLPVTDQLESRLMILPSGYMVSLRDVGVVTDILKQIDGNAGIFFQSLK